MTRQEDWQNNWQTYFDLPACLFYEPWEPNRRKIGDLLEALSSIVILPDDTDQPGWFDRRESGTIIAANNGLLDLVLRNLHPPTPVYFNLVSVPFAYEPHAAEPRYWLNFLSTLWPHDANAINLLAEWFGYVISGRTDLHRIMLMIGPTRGRQRCNCAHAHRIDRQEERRWADAEQLER